MPLISDLVVVQMTVLPLFPDKVTNATPFLAYVIPLLEFVVREGALVGVALGDDGELVAPLELPHVRRLRPPFHLALGNLKEMEEDEETAI